MCILGITHRLIHDKRTTISLDPATPDGRLVNPYGSPEPCRCGQTSGIAAYLRCDDHDCCRTIARLERCSEPKPCDRPTPFHRYEKRTLVPWYADADDDVAWDPLLVIESQLYYRDNATGLVQRSAVMALRAEQVGMQGVLGLVGTKLTERAMAVDAAVHAYESEENAMCRRVLNPWEDPAAVQLGKERAWYALCKRCFWEIADYLVFLDAFLLKLAKNDRPIF